MPRPTFTAICIDDSVTTCDCCGRVNLKATVLLQSDLGDLVHFGRTCAARNTGKTSQQITAEVRAERDLAHGRAVNRLLDLRRAGTQITRELVREVAAAVRADAQLLIRQWV
jgi:hypothetical protein